MELGLKDRKALVTAASRGLGRGCAEALAGEGARVIVSSRGEEELARTAAEIGAAGWQAADMSDPEAPARLVEHAVRELGGLDILVVNAGGPPPGTFDSTPLEAWEQGYQLTLMSMVRLVKAALPYLRRSDQARVVAVTSSTVREPIGTLVLSGAFRSALVTTLKTLAGEFAAEGVTFNNIAPGRFLTDRIRSLARASAASSGSTEDQALRSEEASIPMRRFGTTQEFGAVCAFLCSRQAGYVTGQTILVDGALTKGVY